MIAEYDLAVVGGGILGLAQAWMGVRAGRRVVLLERSPVAQGASVRNFGMIWPVGQPAGELTDLALRSRELWLELKAQGVLDVEECGSVHLAHRDDEQAVLEEFCRQGTHDTHLLTAAEVLHKVPLANPQGLRCGLWSGTELRVDPRTASARIAAWLTDQQEVECHFNTTITHIDGNVLSAADGRRWSAGQIVICSGSDLATLCPDVLRNSGLRLCKLQMLKTVAQSMGRQLIPHVASGLTLRHYASFAGCPSLSRLRARVAAESPELDRYGIHVMASTFPGGEVILGDSHEYDAAISPFDKCEIDELMLRELRKVICLPDWTIRERWSGTYARHPTLPVFEAAVAEGVGVFVGTGGAGMTMAFGLAERFATRWTGTAS